MRFNRPKITYFRLNRFCVPVIVFALIIYATWAYCHKFCYDQVYVALNHKSIAIGLIVAEIILALLVFGIWLQLVLIGPGKQPRVPPFRIVQDLGEEISSIDDEKPLSSIIPPDVYQCDPQGYPIWCSTCQSLKMERTHHSSTLGYCISRFDHYCVWIGTVVGRKNYRLFIQFNLYCDMLFCLIIISICCYLPRIVHQHKRLPQVNPNILITLGLDCVGFLMVTPLLLSHIYYMMTNRTSIEILATKRHAKATQTWFCYYNAVDGYRYVVEFLPREMQDFWNKHKILINIKEFLGQNAFMWLIPIGSNIEDHDAITTNFDDILGPYRETISQRFREIIEHKIEKGEYVKSMRVYGDRCRDTLDDSM